MNLLIDKILLFPYYLTLKCRDRRYSKPGRSKSGPVPTISLGNVTVGGTGKTPHTEMVLRELLEMDEFKDKQLAVLSLGYKRESKGFQQVTVQGGAAMSGDEPLQIKKNFPQVTVAVDGNRLEGCGILTDPEKFRKSRKARKCWFPEFPAADFIILDDALQYRKLRPNLNVILVDSHRLVFQDHLLPFGRLRDLPERIWTADVLIVTKCREDITPEEKSELASRLRVEGFDPATSKGRCPDGRELTVLFTSIQYCEPVPVYPDGEVRYAYARRLVLFSGIANDTPLVRHLSDSWKIKCHLKFPDHHKYTWPDVQKIMAPLKKDPTLAVMTTEKDAQRILEYVGMPELVRRRLLAVPIKVVFTTESERKIFREKLRTIA